MKSMRHKKILSALYLIIAFSTIGPALADPVSSLAIQDIDGDVKSGLFTFGPIADILTIGVPFSGDTGTDMLWGGTTQGPDIFTTGFPFAGVAFRPQTDMSATLGTNNGAVGDITVDANGSYTLNISSLDFGGTFADVPGTQPVFYLAPDSGSLTVHIVNNIGPDSNGDGQFEVRFDWTHLITAAEDPSFQFVGFTAAWALEGIMVVSDSAPTIFANGSLNSQTPINQPYTDPGALCQDVIEGDVSASITTVPADPGLVDTSAVGSFTVTYNCQDGAGNVAAPVVRTVNVVSNDTDPPVLTLAANTVPEQGRNDPDPATVNILVGIDYVDAGATCIDAFDGDISGDIVTTGLPVDTDVAGATTVTFDCSDNSSNAAPTKTRTVNVIADNQPPTITLQGVNPLNVAVGSVFNDPGATCTDTNPVDAGEVDISDKLNVNPTSIDTSAAGTFTIAYDCSDVSGNPAEQKTRTVNVVAGQNFRIISMTISDLDNDGLAACFKFVDLDPSTCSGANLFSSDDSGSLGDIPGAERIPGSGTDLDASGEPIGVIFGEFQTQAVTERRDPTSPPAVTTAAQVPISGISPGFLFTAFPFVPVTFDPNTETGGRNPEVATPPSGFVTVTGTDSALLTIESMPFGGLFNSNQPNLFFLDPDEGTLATQITQINPDDDGNTRTFHYIATWNHLITEIEDPTFQFNGFNANWRLEGVVTTESSPFVVNGAPRVTAMQASQDGRDPTTVIVADGGLVTVSVTAVDPDNDGLTYDWSQNAVSAVGAIDQPSFTFDPAGLVSGALGLTVIVSDDNAEPLSVVGETVLNVSATAPALSSTQDSDGDGVSDADEGFGDQDNDGISDYQDPIDGTTDPSRNRIDFRNPSRGDIASSAGRLRLGNSAAATAEGTFVVTEQDIEQFGGPGATPTTNFHDRLNDVGNVGPIENGIRDFIIDGITPGSSVQIVIPQDRHLPSVPQYRKYTPDTGWVLFSRVSGNAWASAPKVNGVCPEPNDPAYDSPTEDGSTLMVAGDECVRLTIVDGGINDADRTINGSIVDPGTVASNGAASSATSSSDGAGCVLNTDARNTHVRGDWFLLLIGVLGLGVFRWLGLYRHN